MHVQYVNGTPCYNCSDVERAKKAALQGHKADDPLHPSTTVTSGDQPAGDNTASASSAGGPRASDAVGINQPLASGDRGTALNLLL